MTLNALFASNGNQLTSTSRFLIVVYLLLNDCNSFYRIRTPDELLSNYKSKRPQKRLRGRLN